jgi:hypothetical protein
MLLKGAFDTRASTDKWKGINPMKPAVYGTASGLALESPAAD